MLLLLKMMLPWFLFSLLLHGVQSAEGASPPWSPLTEAVAAPNITVRPSNMTLTSDQADKGDGHMDVFCQAPPHNGTHPLWQLSIIHILTSESTVVKAVQNEKDGVAELKRKILGAFVEGNVSVGVLRLRLNKVGCPQSGRYTCKAKYGQDGLMKKKSQNFTVYVKPDKLALTVSPREAPGWKVDDILKMTCQGKVGTLTRKQQLRWVWQYATRSRWLPYDGEPEDVERSPTQEEGSKCYAYASSALTRRLTFADSGRRYRCYVEIGGVAYDQLAAEYPVGTVNPSDGTEGQQPHFHHSIFLGLGVGGCVGMVAGLAGVVAGGVVVLLWRRKKKMLLKERPANCPLLPRARDPTWYGEYLEPVVRVPEYKEEEEDQRSVYSEIPEDIYNSKTGSQASSLSKK